MKRLIPWRTSFAQFSLGSFLNIAFGSVILLLFGALLLAWNVDLQVGKLDAGADTSRIDRMKCAALLDIVVLSGDHLVAVADRKERLIYLHLVNHYIGEFNGVHLQAADTLLQETTRLLEALALQDGLNVDQHGLWVSCRGRMLYLAEALRVSSGSGTGSFQRLAGSDTVLVPVLILAVAGLVMLFVILRVHVANPLRTIINDGYLARQPDVFFYEVSLLGTMSSGRDNECKGESSMLDSSVSCSDDKEEGQRNDLEAAVLLVDDSPLSAEVSRQLLQGAGVSVSVANSGYTALEMAERQVYRMALIDISMPGMDGHEVALRLKKYPRYRHVPLFALTADNVSAVAEKCHAAGMAGVLQKPLGLPLVEALVQRMRGNVDIADVAGLETVMFFDHTYSTQEKKVAGMAVVGESREVGKGESDGKDGACLPVIDVQFTLQEMGIGTEQLDAILGEMKKLIPAYLTDLATLQAGGDSGRLKALAHRIKGEGGNIGAMQVRYAAEQLERATFDNSDEVADRCVRLQEALNELAACIDHGTWRL